MAGRGGEMWMDLGLLEGVDENLVRTRYEKGSR